MRASHHVGGVLLGRNVTMCIHVRPRPTVFVSCLLDSVLFDVSNDSHRQNSNVSRWHESRQLFEDITIIFQSWCLTIFLSSLKGEEIVRGGAVVFGDHPDLDAVFVFFQQRILTPKETVFRFLRIRVLFQSVCIWPTSCSERRLNLCVRYYMHTVSMR